MKSWEPSTLKVYSSSNTRFRNFCSWNSLNPANITLVVFMDYLTHLFKLKPPLTYSTINGHRPVINAKEQRKGVLSILELTSLDDTNSQVCPVRHLAAYLRASKGRRKPHSGDSVFIQNEGKPLDVKEINIIVLSTLSSSGIDISKFKSHSTRSAMASLLSNTVPFYVVKKMGRWKSNDTVDSFYEKRIIGEKSGGFSNTVVQIS
ncbi:hypothetical protein ACTFIR_007493 [Dictyostelium discoideum]